MNWIRGVCIVFSRLASELWAAIHSRPFLGILVVNHPNIWPVLIGTFGRYMSEVLDGVHWSLQKFRQNSSEI